MQIIEYRTARPAEVQALIDEWERATEGKRKARRRILCEDRDVPGRYFHVVMFDSYDEAMENSALPETDALASKLMELAEGPSTFHNLNVVADREYRN